jgi:hypothetical protein
MGIEPATYSLRIKPKGARTCDFDRNKYKPAENLAGLFV